MKRTGHRNRQVPGSVYAIVLTLLMVLSVPVTMPASADVTLADRDLRSDTVEPGGNVTVTLTVAFDRDHSSVSIHDGFAGPVASTSIDSVVVDGSEVNPFFETADNEELAVALQDVSADEQIEITYTVTINEDASNGTTVEFSGRDDSDITAGSDEGDFGTDTVDISTDDGAAFDDGPLALDDGGRYYIGQDLVRDVGVSPNETLDLVHPDGSSSLVFATDQGTATIETAGMMAGQYSLEGEDGTAIASFRLIRHEFTVFSFDAISVENEGPDTNATLTVETNRQPTVHYLTATNGGEVVDASTLQAMFTGAGDVVNDETLRIQGSNTDTFTLDFDSVRSGKFTLTTTSPDTDATASDSITVDAGQQGTASLATQTVSAPAGSVMEIPITLQHTDTATLELGSQDVNYHVTMEIHDDTGDGSITVRWDTQLAGQTGDASAAFSAAGADEVTNVARSTGQFSGLLALESYPISVGVGGTETGLGLATVTDPSNQLCGREVDSLVETYNDNVDDLPGFANGVVTDETVYLFVNGDTQTDYTAVTGSDKHISEFRPGAPDSPTIEVETDCETVTTIVDAQNTGEAFASEYDDGDITVRGTGLLKRIAVGVRELLIEVGQLLGAF